MATRQIFGARLDNGSTANRWMGVAGESFSGWWATVPTATEVATARWSARWENFTFQHLTAPGSGKSFTYTLVKNGVDTSTVITISDGATQGRSTNSIAVVSGDRLYWRRSTSGTPTLSNVRYSSELVHTTANVNGYIGHGQLSSASTFRAPLFYASAWSTTVVNANNNIVSIAGNLTELHYELSTAPGSGKSYTIALYKNGTVQDGAGGTTDTRVTIANTATSGTWSGSIALVASDYVTLEAVPSTTPAVAFIGTTVTFAPTTDGESMCCAVPFVNLPTTGINFFVPEGTTDSTGLSATEASVDLIGGVNQFHLRGFRVRLTNTVTTGPCTFTTRRNSVSPTGTPEITLTSGQQTGSDAVGDVLISDGNTWSIRFNATGSPGLARTASFSWALFAIDVSSPEPGVPVTTIAGVLTPIKRNTLTINEVVNGRNTLSCDVISTTGTLRPAIDAEVVVYLNNVRIFGGTVSTTHEYGIAGPFGVGIFTRVAVNDFNSLADRRYVKETLAAGTIKSMLETLVANYLIAYGVELDLSQVTGPAVDALSYDYRQLTEVLNDLATVAYGATGTGWVWEIDYDKVLRMYETNTIPAPFDIINNDGNAIGDIMVDQGAGYANRIILRAGTAIKVQKTESFTGDGVTATFPLKYPIAGYYGYTSDGAVGYGFVTVSWGTTESLGGPTSPQIWHYDPATQDITRTLGAPANGDTFSLFYDVQFPITVIAEDVPSQAAPTGIREIIIEKPDVFDIDVAQAIADSELAAALARPTTVHYQTRDIGLKPGQTQTITVTRRNINAAYLINDIQSRDSGDKYGTLIRTVTATQGTSLKPTWRDVYKQWGTSSGATAPVG